MTTEGDRELEDLFASYVDRLNAGEELDAQRILAENPIHGAEILDHIADYVAVAGGADAVPASSVALGTLGDYTLRRQIGRGGMGLVYEAWENSMDRPVALKVLPAAVAADTRTVTRFVREAQIAGKLSHPNVVSVYAVGVKGAVPYYAMELVEGETLAQIVARMRTRVEGEAPAEPSFGAKRDEQEFYLRLARAFADAADGLQHAHSRGVVHRDIKPSNLILDRGAAHGSRGGDGAEATAPGSSPEGASAPRLRILDFGLARLEGQESLSASGDVVGTPLYMSPEQARRRKVPVDHRTDVYSLGATLYEVLTLEPPFRGRDHEDTLSQIITRDPRPPRQLNPRVPRDLETIVLKCLRKEPADRYGTAEALGQDLRRFVRGDPIEARHEAGLEKLGRWFRRSRPALVAVALVTAFALVAMWALWRGLEAARFRRLADYREAVLGATLKMEWASETLEQRVGGGLVHAFMETSDRSRLPGMEGIEAAVDTLAVLERLLPDRPDAGFQRVRGLVLLGREDEAVRELDALERRHPGFVPGILFRSGLLRRRGDRDEAARLEAAARGMARGTHAENWVEAAIAARSGRWGDAAGAYGRFLETDGEDLFIGARALARLGRGTARLALEDPLSALEDFVVARYLLPGAGEPVLYAGKACCLLGRDEHAEKLFRSLHAESAEPDQVALCVALVYSSLGRHEDRLAWIDRVAAAPLRETRRARVLLDLGRRKEALEASRRAVDLSPLDAEAAYNHGFILYILGRHEEGARFAREAVRAMPGKASLYHTLRLNLEGLVRFDEALDASQRCVELRPDSSIAHSVHGLYLGWSGRLDEALVHIDRSEALAPRSCTPPFHRACVLFRFGRDEESLRELDRSIALDTRASYARLARGGCLLALGRLAEAERAFEEALDAVPPDPATRACIGWIREMLGDPAAASEAYIEALEDDPGTVDAHRRLWILLRYDGDTFARESLDRLESALAETAASSMPDPRALLTLSMACARARDAEARERALELALRGLDAAGREYPGTAVRLAAWLCEVLDASSSASSSPSPRSSASSGGAATGPLALLPRLPPPAAMEALLATVSPGSPSLDPSALSQLQARATTPDGRDRAAFLEALLRERSGDLAGAAELLQDLHSRSPSHLEALVALARVRRLQGDAPAAESLLRGAIEAGPIRGAALWRAWAAVSLTGLGRAPADLLAAFPRLPPTDPSSGSEVEGPHPAAREPEAVADLRWLLERLAAGEPIRINCGGKDLVDAGGKTWSVDRFYRRGAIELAYPKVRNTESGALYHSSRRYDTEDQPLAAYLLPLPPGPYRVSLHFCETFFRVGGMRPFDVMIQGTTELEGYDPSSVGFGVADTREFPAEVTDGILEVRLIAGRGDSPTIAGIEVEPLGGSR